MASAAKPDQEVLKEVWEKLGKYFRPFIPFDVHIPIPLIQEAGVKLASMQGSNLSREYFSNRRIAKWKSEYLGNPLALSFGVTIDRIEETEDKKARIIKRLLIPSRKILVPNKNQGKKFKFAQPHMNQKYVGPPAVKNNYFGLEIGAECNLIYSASALVSSRKYQQQKKAAIQTFLAASPAERMRAKSRLLSTTEAQHPSGPADLQTDFGLTIVLNQSTEKKAADENDMHIQKKAKLNESDGNAQQEEDGTEDTDDNASLSGFLSPEEYEYLCNDEEVSSLIDDSFDLNL